jgi:hypothetical protein
MRFQKNLQVIVTCFLSSTILFKVLLVQFSALALEFDGRNNITLNSAHKINATDNNFSNSDKLDASQNKALLIQSLKDANSNLHQNKQLSELIPIELITANNANVSENNLLTSDKVDSPQSKALLIQTLKDANSDLQRTKQLSEFTIPDVTPIELIAENNANFSDKSLLNSDKVDNPQSKVILKDTNSDLQRTKQLSEFTIPDVIPIELIAENNANVSDKSFLNSDKVDSQQSKSLLKETLKDANSGLQKPKQLSEFTIADVIPIEEYKVEPPKPPDEGEEETKPNTTKPNTPTQQILIEKLRRSKKQQQTQQKKIIIDALTFSANKYPWIVNPTDNLTFSTELFKPNENENYIDTDISLKFSGDNQIINKFTYAKFPKADQFYWVLDNNRIVVETKGSQVGILSQGRETNTYITQNVTSQQAFWGLQTLFAIPTDFQNLFGTVDAQDFSITSIAGTIDKS